MTTWTPDRVRQLVERMEKRISVGFSVSAETAWIVVEALKHYAREHFAEQPASYQIDIWSANFSRVESHYGDVADLFAATEVYEWVVRQRPAAYVTLRQGARVIERSKEKLRP